MSATIFYEPVDPEPASIGVSAPSSFMDAMARAGFSLPCELEGKDIPTLQGMAAVAEKSGYGDVIKAINKHGKIRLWAEY
jgi:hypothetical protein